MTTIALRLLAVLWAAGIAVFSLIPSDMAPSSGYGDKAEHALGYAALALLIALGWRRLPLAFLLSCLFGIAIELMQATTGYRVMDAWDAIANAIGAAIGISLAAPILNRFRAKPE